MSSYDDACLPYYIRHPSMCLFVTHADAYAQWSVGLMPLKLDLLSSCVGVTSIAPMSQLHYHKFVS